MNIFVFDEDLELCAKYHCDKYVVKMPLEYAQLLCSAHHVSNSKYSILYKLTHRNHPCSVWIRENLKNYLWLCNLGLKVCKEYTYRYNKTHKCENVIKFCIENFPNVPTKERTPFVQAMPDQYKCEDAVKAYRNYYLGEKKHLFAWKNRSTPYWIEEKL